MSGPVEPKSDLSAGRSGRRAWSAGLVQLVFVIGVIAGAVGFSSALKGKESANRPKLADLRGESVIAVRVVQPERVQYAPSVRANGTIQTNAEIAVSPQVSGEIKTVSAGFRAGSDVKRGDMLFEIDKADFLLAVERAEAEIAAARSDLAQLEADAELAIQEWEELYPDREINSLAARAPQIEAAKARLNSAIANKRTAELSLKRTRVSAPVDARVISSSLDVGQVVSPGQVVGRLVSLDSIELVVPLSLEQQALLEPVLGREARFQRRGVSSSGEELARVVRVDASLDERTRLSNLFLKPDNQTDLRIGDFVDVTLTGPVYDGAFVLPATALSRQNSVWVVQQGRLASRRVLVIGERDAGNEILTAPFDTGNGVVALPPLEAREGQETAIRKAVTVTTSLGGLSNAAK